ncbi:MAG TPA: PIN domain nuclease [Nitrospira sp.]|nr:PIN domain nuclease [Nitrospira sp.]HBR48583.1 PIN domain nuclease [Nitrospira sp.]
MQFLIGTILQELLDELRSPKHFDHLFTLLDPCPPLELTRPTHVAAARLRANCRAKGVSGGAIDFLITAACCQYGFPLLTADQDFAHIPRHCHLVTLPT